MSLLHPVAPVAEPPLPRSAGADPASTPGYQLIRRNGAVTPFDPAKIALALTKAFLVVEGWVAVRS
ncbi:hypothetical protein, partial [Halohasta litorea]